MTRLLSGRSCGSCGSSDSSSCMAQRGSPLPRSLLPFLWASGSGFSGVLPAVLPPPPCTHQTELRLPSRAGCTLLETQDKPRAPIQAESPGAESVASELGRLQEKLYEISSNAKPHVFKHKWLAGVFYMMDCRLPLPGCRCSQSPWSLPHRRTELRGMD